MTDTQQHFDRQAGDDFRIRDTVTDDDSEDEFRDLTDHDGRFVLSTYPGGEVLTEIDDTSSDFDVTDPSSGEVEVFVAGDNTEDHGGNDLYYEIEFTSPTDEDHTVTTGTITVDPSH